MGLIRILPEAVANKIAAGEVIERPASIVKELVENALDAGARSVEIAVRHGGKSLIRVADDGCGMEADDAELAFQRHATSKIRKADDLFSVQSFGFRGEALPSIAAVSRVKMITRPAGSDTGTEIILEGGLQLSVKEAASRRGTIFEVRDLFFNTPARRKFLKSDSAEAGQVEEVIANLALSRPDVQFILKSADQTIYSLPAGQDLRERIAVLYNESSPKNFLDLEAKDKQGIKVRGVIAKPSVSRANRSGQIFYVNGRWIRSTSLAYALLAGYHGLLMHGQFPVGVIFIDLDLARVDVNVHPSKLEVRISNEMDVKNLIRDAVGRTLEKAGEIAPELKAPAAMPSAFSGPSGASVPFWNEPFIPTGAARGTATAEVTGTGLHFPVESPGMLPEIIVVRNKLKITKVLGQIHHTFVVAESEEGILIIDQHAAHERVNFEALCRNFENAKPASQKLLLEEIVPVAKKHRDHLEARLPVLQKIGFEIEGFGKGDYRIGAVPAVLSGENPRELLREFLEQLEDGKVHTDLEHAHEEIAALIACKRKSVKAHDPMTPQALRQLVESLAACENPFACPHGRPSFLKYSFLDLEKQFRRK